MTARHAQAAGRGHLNVDGAAYSNDAMGQEPVERVHHPLDRRPNPPSSRLERDFCRRRLARQKGREDDVSAQRPEIGDQRAREMAAKTAFLLASYQLRVSEDWVVGAIFTIASC